ncbi:FixH family protein [Pedobacter sp. ASV12]|uniref:FixH family protein n=1 Tax=Pedobacter sp. ASV12 TaxID=2795120 RepID=UPI0018EDB5F5|nr:FixH family protein [Pedobacter sp. ASV12]
MNWGRKIVLGMAIFMLFIISMVVYMFKVHGNDALMEDDYYERGINYDVDYKAINNVFADKAEPKISITASQVIIQLSDSVAYDLKLKCASAAKDDLGQTGATVGQANLILLDRAKLRKGLWFVELRWTNRQKAYFFKKDLML